MFERNASFSAFSYQVLFIKSLELFNISVTIFRNLNTIRAIAQDHGNPIDRYTVLARVATKCIFSKQDTFFRRLSNMIGRLYFELMLL